MLFLSAIANMFIMILVINALRKLYSEISGKRAAFVAVIMIIALVFALMEFVFSKYAFVLAGISVIGAVKSAATIALIVPILALGVPIMDTSFAIIRRYRGGVPIFKPDKGHLHHRLMDLGFSQRQAVLLMYVISALLGLSAVALTEVSYQFAIAIVCLVVVLVLYGAKKIGIFRMNDSAHQH